MRDLTDFEALEDAGLLSKEKLLAGDIPTGLVSGEGDGEEEPAVDMIAAQMKVIEVAQLKKSFEQLYRVVR